MIRPVRKLERSELQVRLLIVVPLLILAELTLTMFSLQELLERLLDVVL